MKTTVAYLSDVGLKRTNNEDYLLVDEDRNIFILADGMGGHQAGEVASKIAVESAYTYLKDGLEGDGKEKTTFELLTESIFHAHEAIKEKAKADLKLLGMGTTLIVMLIKENIASICHVGDSRVYHIPERTVDGEGAGSVNAGAGVASVNDNEIIDNEIIQVTRDHTMGDYLVRQKLIRLEDIPPFEWHILTQAVGVSEDLVPEPDVVKLDPGDILLLCSDGLNTMLTDSEIYEVVTRHRGHVKEAAQALVDEANQKGGLDNITVILIECG
jgi:serine/threonine protein phosphatase PrpC